MKWFGESWGAPVCTTTEKVEVAPDTPCFSCSKPILPGDRGVVLPFVGRLDDSGEFPWHLDCFLESLGLKEQPNACHNKGNPEEPCSCERPGT